MIFASPFHPGPNVPYPQCFSDSSPNTLKFLSLCSYWLLLGRFDPKILFIFCSLTQTSFLLSLPQPQREALSLHTYWVTASPTPFLDIILHLTCFGYPLSGCSTCRSPIIILFFDYSTKYIKRLSLLSKGNNYILAINIVPGQEVEIKQWDRYWQAIDSMDWKYFS